MRSKCPKLCLSCEAPTHTCSDYCVECNHVDMECFNCNSIFSMNIPVLIQKFKKGFNPQRFFCSWNCNINRVKCTKGHDVSQEESYRVEYDSRDNSYYKLCYICIKERSKKDQSSPAYKARQEKRKIQRNVAISRSQARLRDTECDAGKTEMDYH